MANRWRRLRLSIVHNALRQLCIVDCPNCSVCWQGLKLQEAGHRVRLATHGAYRDFVQGFGLEFYPLGGDPKLLSQYIVKHRAPPMCHGHALWVL